MWRAGFGPAAAQLPQLSTLSTADLFAALQAASAKTPAYIDVADDYLKGLRMGIDEVGRMQRKMEMTDAQRKEVRQRQREGVKNLNLTWLHQMVSSNAQLREKMAFFWHGHFAARNLNVFYQQQLLDVIRQHALGSFRTLLHEVSKSAAMLNFLNAQQNRKGRPNENFAREVMELFTMGRGHYTEQDIKEAARAFTGWGANLEGEFQFRMAQHDDGEKTIMGYTAKFRGEEVLDLLLAQKQTAQFIAAKIYRLFVNEQENKKHIDWLADRFFKSEYNIGVLMQDLFTADWFYEDKNIGSKIKSPIELVAGMQRMLPMELDNEESLLVMQRLLGQMLFYPPNVAGWPGGRTWIDSSTLLLRMRLPQLFAANDALNLRPKTDDDVMGGRTDSGEPDIDKPKRGVAGMGKPLGAQIAWNEYSDFFKNISRDALPAAVQAQLLQVPLRTPLTTVQRYTDAASRDAFIKSMTVQLMSTPEYQLC